MFRQIFHLAGRFTTPILHNSACILKQNILPKPILLNSFFNKNMCTLLTQKYEGNQFLKDSNVPQLNHLQVRTVTKYSWAKGRRKTVKAVLNKFYRLAWGGWIRTRCGRSKKLWKKRAPRRRRLRQHVLCNATQSTLLDKMVGDYWKKRKYYVDDPYEPYHTREEFMYSSKKPVPYIPPEER